jgi:hypothetical protein
MSDGREEREEQEWRREQEKQKERQDWLDRLDRPSRDEREPERGLRVSLPPALPTREEMKPHTQSSPLTC